MQYLGRITVPEAGLEVLDFTNGFTAEFTRYVLKINNLRRNDTMPGGFPGQETIFVATAGDEFDTGGNYSSSATALVNASLAPGGGPNPATPQGIYQFHSAPNGLCMSVDCLNPEHKGLCGEVVITSDGNATTYRSDMYRFDQQGNILISKYAGSYDGSTLPITALRIALDPPGAKFLAGGSVDLYAE